MAVVFGGLGLASEWEEVAATVSTPNPWRAGGLALAAGEPLAAAEIFRDVGARPFEADALLVAGRSGLDSDLAPAIDLAEAESLGATTRSA